jgi:hypothetical protein
MVADGRWDLTRRLEVYRKTVSLVPRFLLTHVVVLHFFLYKGTRCLKLLITALEEGEITVKLSPECPLHRNNWFMLLKLQHTKRSPLQSHHYRFVTSQTVREEGSGIAHAHKTSNTCCFIPCGKLTNACVFKAVMADWNRSSHFNTPCIFRFNANEEMRCCSEPVFMALKNLLITEPQGPEFISVSVRPHLIRVPEVLILHLMPRFRLRQFHYNIKLTSRCNCDPLCFLWSRTCILCRVRNSAY